MTRKLLNINKLKRIYDLTENKNKEEIITRAITEIESLAKEQEVSNETKE